MDEGVFLKRSLFENREMHLFEGFSVQRLRLC